MKEKQPIVNSFCRQSNPYCIDNYHIQDEPQIFVDYLLANFCMPTLLKLKPSSLIRVIKKTGVKESDLLIAIESRMKQFKSHYYILFKNEEIISLFIYNEELLLKILIDAENEKFFLSNGYHLQSDTIRNTLETLKLKFTRYYNKSNEVATFPHEIGLLLGYPLIDVEEFVRNKGKNYILCGCWKVYHNAEEAINIFDSYKRIREDAVALLIEGKKINDILKQRNMLKATQIYKI